MAPNSVKKPSKLPVSVVPLAKTSSIFCDMILVTSFSWVFSAFMLLLDLLSENTFFAFWMYVSAMGIKQQKKLIIAVVNCEDNPLPNSMNVYGLVTVLTLFPYCE